MDQETLREFENRCVQEAPAECVAACPIHLDARAFIGAIQAGDWDGAWRVLRKTMPFPAILGRICDAPCRARCKRGEVDDPILVGELERACVARPAPRFRLPPLPRKSGRVAILGSGLSSLTAAGDLARKGYEVTIFEPAGQLGGALRNIHPDRLPPDAIDDAVAFLEKTGCRIEPETAVDSTEFAEHCRDRFDAVYIGLDSVTPDGWPLDRTDDGSAAVTPKTQVTSLDGVFAGGGSSVRSLTVAAPESADSPVRQAAEGRWAAASIDRWLQNASLTAGRDKDGPYPTRLFTQTSGVSPRPAVPPDDPAGGFTDDEARAEADRCLQCECLECVKRCVYLEAFGGYPKKYAREIYNNESIVMAARQANKLINSCSLCGLCEEVCPEGFALWDLCLEARRRMVRQGKMPPSAHEFALLDMAFSGSDRFALARHAPGTSASRWAFFPGCQLCASSPDQVRRVYGHLRDRLDGGVGLILGCCAAPAHWAGREETFQRELDAFRATWKGLGEPEVIPACATCFKIFKDHLPEVSMVSLWEILDTRARPEPPDAAAAGPVTGHQAIHDPCTTRHEPALREAVRRLAAGLGIPVSELSLSGRFTECCGFGGLMQIANPSLGERTAAQRAARGDEDYIAYCALCRDNLARTGKRVVHLLDLLFPDPDCRETDPATRPPPGWSERRDNRAWLKRTLITELWKDEAMAPAEHQRIVLRISPEVRNRLDDRRILDEDIQRVIGHAESTGRKFRNPDTGHFKASFKPHNATFWVEYTPEGDGFRVHAAYAHRMEVTRS